MRLAKQSSQQTYDNRIEDESGTPLPTPPRSHLRIIGTDSCTSCCRKCCKKLSAGDLRRFFFIASKAAASNDLVPQRPHQKRVKRGQSSCTQFSGIAKVPNWRYFSQLRSVSIEDRRCPPMISAKEPSACTCNSPARVCHEVVHVSLMRKLFFSLCCSNRNAVPAIRAGADATPPLDLARRAAW